MWVTQDKEKAVEHPLKKEHWMAGRFLPILTILFFLLLFAIAVYRLYQNVREVPSTLVADHIEKLAGIFKKIEETGGIDRFDEEKNRIDFLNVKSFVGSKVGSLTLYHPERWQGPYIDENPTIQDKPYVVVKTSVGYYIVPGDGVKLSNGKVIGKDIVIDKNTDFEKLTRDPQGLLHENRPLAVLIKRQGEKCRCPA